VEHLYVYGPQYLVSEWRDSLVNAQWLEILHPFIAVKNFYICREFAQCVATSLQKPVGERLTDGLLLALETFFFGRAPVLRVGAYPRRHWDVRFCARAVWSPYNRFLLEAGTWVDDWMDERVMVRTLL
jgi:hypothetical protein